MIISQISECYDIIIILMNFIKITPPNAQLVERRHVNPEVIGSNPTLVNSLFNPKTHFKIYPVSFPCGLYWK